MGEDMSYRLIIDEVKRVKFCRGYEVTPLKPNGRDIVDREPFSPDKRLADFCGNLRWRVNDDWTLVDTFGGVEPIPESFEDKVRRVVREEINSEKLRPRP
uniref:Uncharacterized protein n=1 Tax=viral metagenome TaxID=1070528 RepID=A0A6M3LGM3_9ZZZZ